VLCITTEFEDVPKRDPHVFQDLPRGIRQSGDAFATTRDGKIGDEVIESDVRTFAAKNVEHVVTKRLVGV
jgi:hypothetical protein